MFYGSKSLSKDLLRIVVQLELCCDFRLAIMILEFNLVNSGSKSRIKLLMMWNEVLLRLGLNFESLLRIGTDSVVYPKEDDCDWVSTLGLIIECLIVLVK
jgi:hypothetical protein